MFKKMCIVCGCDIKCNVLVYFVYFDKLIEGSFKNFMFMVLLMFWGDVVFFKCGDYISG